MKTEPKPDDRRAGSTHHRRRRRRPPPLAADDGGSGDDGGRSPNTAAPHRLLVGALEDAVKWPQRKIADRRIALAPKAGFDMLDITTPWTPGQTRPDPRELKILRNVAASTSRRHSRLLITVYAPRPRYAPVSEDQQDEYAEYLATLARDLPSVRDFAVWNEPNLNGFWLYQFDESGRDVAAPAYTSLLARSYDALKDVSPKIRVYGGSLAPRGADNPDGRRHTQSPTAFIRDMGRAYRSSGRSKPIMDVFAIHPYLQLSAQPPSTKHPRGTTIGIADYDKLVRLLGKAFDGTAQPGSKLPIAYTEFGVQATIPKREQALYTNLDSPFGEGRGRRGDAGALLPPGARARRLPADGHRAHHLPPVRRGRPRPVAVRPLLPGHEAEVEPPGDQGRRGEGSRGEARHLFVRFRA